MYHDIYNGWAGYKSCILPQRPPKKNPLTRIANTFNKTSSVS